MSVHFTCVRFSSIQQNNIAGSDEDYCWQDLCVDELPSDFQSYNLFTFISIGWRCGAHIRVKQLPPKRAFVYLNKLIAGGWIDSDEYHRVWGASLRLLQKNISMLDPETRSIVGQWN